MTLRSAFEIFCPSLVRAYKARIGASPLGRRLIDGAFWLLAGALAARGLGLVSAIVVARILGRHDFGQLGMIQSTVGMFGGLAGFGMGLTAAKHVAEFRSQDPSRAGRIIALSSLTAFLASGTMAATLLILAPWIATRTLGSAEMTGMLRTGALVLLLGGIDGAQTGALSGFEAFKSMARINVLAGLLAFPITLACASWFGVLGAVWALASSFAIRCGLSWLALRGEARRNSVPVSFRGCTGEWRVLCMFSIPAALGGALVAPVVWASNAILANQQGGYAELGLYHAVMRVKAIPEMVLSTVLAPIVPVLSQQFGRGETAAYNKTLRYAFAVSLLVILPPALAQLAAPWWTFVPFGREFHVGADSVVEWLMIYSVFWAVFYPFGSILPSVNRMWIGFGYNVCLAGSLLVLSMAWIPDQGALGLARATTCAYLIASLSCVGLLYFRHKGLLVDARLRATILWVVALIAFSFGLRRLLPPGWPGPLAFAISAAYALVKLRRSPGRPSLRDGNHDTD